MPTVAGALVAGVLALVLLVPGLGGDEVVDVLAPTRSTEPTPQPRDASALPHSTPTSPPTATTPPPSPAPTPTPVEETPASQPFQADCGKEYPKRAESPEGMEVALELEGHVFAHGEEITMTVRAKNVSAQPIRNEYSGPRADVWVEDDEHRIWMWSFGRVFPAVQSEETFAPGEEKTEVMTWKQQLCDAEAGEQRGGPPPPGHYVAHGGWTTTEEGSGGDAWWSNPVEFEIR